MRVISVTENKKDFLPLLLLADEQEEMIDRYLARGEMYVLKENGRALASVVVTDEGDGVLEIKNLAVDPAVQRCGYGRKMMDYIVECYRSGFHTILVGTGDSPLTIPFYERCGFVRSHVIKDFFIDHYDHPIIEGGVQLRDMIYLKKTMD